MKKPAPAGFFIGPSRGFITITPPPAIAKRLFH